MTHQGLGEWMPLHRTRSPEKVALVHGDGETVSYGQLAERVERAATLLAERGIRFGDRVAYLGENSPEFVEVLFACARLGAIFVPINTRLAAPEISHVLSDSGARLLVHDEALDATASAATELPRLVVGAGGSYALALAAAEGPAPALAPATLDDPALIMYTSGTTGRPKGAVLSHGNLTWNALNVLIDYDVSSSEVALMISPLFHAAALGMGALPVLLKGGTLALEVKFDPARTLHLIEMLGVTMLSGVPTTFQLMADHESWDATELGSLTKLTCGGALVPGRILDAYEARGLHFSQGYGMTETSPGATYLQPTMTRPKRGSVGLPHYYTRIRIVDGNEHTVPAGAVGEVQIAGPNVMLRYHDNPEATVAAFTPDGWLRSGDLGYLDDDGYLYLSDRLKDMIISGAENIYPAEIEGLIMDAAEVTGVAVIGAPDERWGEVPWAVLTLRAGATLDEEALTLRLNGLIARYKVPKRYIVVDELPRTASGKIRKAELRERYAPAG